MRVSRGCRRENNHRLPREAPHDAPEFPSGHVALLTRLCVGQWATVLQLLAGVRLADGTHEAGAAAELRGSYIRRIAGTGPCMC
jgi:hypothetical protein